MVYSLARLAGEDGACDTREMVWEIMNGVDRHTPAPNTPVYSNSCEENNNTSLAVCSLDYLSVCLFVGLSVCLAVCSLDYLSVCSLDYLSVRWTICLFSCLFVGLSVCLAVCSLDYLSV